MNPKGTRDLNPDEVRLYSALISKIKKSFINYGGNQIDTPVIEKISTVKNLYGDDFNKEVYLLQKEMHENADNQLILRYDLTVPLARYVATNGLDTFKRYQIGKVYRKDTPKITQGRFREFYQCDFDIVSPPINKSTAQPSPMIQEAEILDLLIHTLKSTINDNFFVIINDKKILFEVLMNIGVTSKQLGPICSTIDKFDKKTTEQFDEELACKGLTGDTIAKINQFISFSKDYNTQIDPSKVIKNKLINLVKQKLLDEKSIENMLVLVDILEKMDNINYIRFDPSLARGLDYYTGLIYEAVYTDKTIMPSSIAAGGRYNNMIGKISKKTSIPAIGLSLGLDRLAVIVKNKIGICEHNPLVYITTIGKNLASERMKLCSELRKAGIFAEMPYSKNVKMGKVLNTALSKNVKFLLILGKKELTEGNVRVKTIETKEQVDIKRENIIDFLKGKI